MGVWLSRFAQGEKERERGRRHSRQQLRTERGREAEPAAEPLSATIAIALAASATMEQLLQEIGVSQDQESQIVARALEEAGLPSTFGSDSLRLEHAIVENAVPIPFPDDIQQDSSLPSSVPQKRRVILLPEEWKAKREQEARARKPATELNSLIIEAMRKPAKKARSDMDSDGPSEVTCCLCGKSFSVDVNQADVFLASHMHYCERRASRRSGAAYATSSSAASTEEASEREEETRGELKARFDECDLSSDSEGPNSLAAKSQSMRLRRLRRLSGRSAQSKASPNPETSAGGSSPNEQSRSATPTEVNCVDDWEDDQYEERQRGLSEEESEVIRTDFGGRIHARTWERLHKYQQQGCEWLHGLYREGTGGILADEMGRALSLSRVSHPSGPCRDNISVLGRPGEDGTSVCASRISRTTFEGSSERKLRRVLNCLSCHRFTALAERVPALGS